METKERIRHNSSVAAQNSDFYDDYWDLTGIKISSQHRKRAVFTEKALADFVGRRNLQILDLGCGRGWMSVFLSTWGEYIGVDFSEKPVEFARSNYGRFGKFVVADPEDARLGLAEDVVFDVVVCSEVIEHVHDQEALIAQISQFLKPGGWCVLTTPNGNAFKYFEADDHYRRKFQPIEDWLTPNQCAELVENGGFKVLRHYGSVYPKMRPGPFGWLQHGRIGRVFSWLRLDNLYSRLILPFAVYQMLFIQKESESADRLRGNSG